jgi:hypothetical protein
MTRSSASAIRCKAVSLGRNSPWRSHPSSSATIRAYWFFGPPDKPRAVSGMDFVILDGGQARTLYAFLDTA